MLGTVILISFLPKQFILQTNAFIWKHFFKELYSISLLFRGSFLKVAQLCSVCVSCVGEDAETQTIRRLSSLLSESLSQISKYSCSPGTTPRLTLGNTKPLWASAGVPHCRESTGLGEAELDSGSEWETGDEVIKNELKIKIKKHTENPMWNEGS